MRRLENGPIKGAPRSESNGTSLEAVSPPAIMRWAIRQKLKERKEYLSTDRYPVGTWMAWRMHMLIALASQLSAVLCSLAP